MIMNSMIDTAYVSIEEYTKMQTKFNEIVEENDPLNNNNYPSVYDALKSARSDWVKLYGHPLIGWQGLTNEEALAFVIRTRFHSYTGEQVMGMSIEKKEMSPIPDTLTTIEDVHEAALKQLIDVPKETVKVDKFSDLLKLKREIAEESRRGAGNYLLINPCFADEVDDYKDLDTDSLRSDFEKVFTVVYSELMPKNKRCGMVVYKGSNAYDSPVFNAVFGGNGYSCLNPDVERYVRKFEW